MTGEKKGIILRVNGKHVWGIDVLSKSKIIGVVLVITVASVSIYFFTTFYVQLKVNVETSHFWTRGSDDLPVCVYNIVYIIRNYGMAEGKDISLTLTTGGSSRSLGSISLKAGETYSGSTTVQFKEGVYDIEVKAQSAYSSANDIVKAVVVFPRSPIDQPKIMQLYITPNNPTIMAQLNYIIKNKPWYRTWYGGVQEWVSQNIKYKYDNSVYGTSDYWQLPTETLNLHTGDCEDFAILLCTFFRAAGIPPDQVYVAIGVNDQGKWHAYLLEYWYYKKWRVIEPQAGGLFETDLAAWRTATEYQTKYIFNDVYYHSYLPS